RVARTLRDVDRDVARVLPHVEVRRHRLLRIGDLAADDVAHRLDREALLLVRRERVVEVRTDRPGRLRVGQRVARGTRIAGLGRGEEELLAVGRITARRAPDCAAARRGDRDEREEKRVDEEAAQGYELGWETPSRLEIASSRVSWIANTRSRPVISKIFVMLRSLQTSESWPSFVRSRLTPPTSTPSVVESMKVVELRSTTTCFPPWPITSRSCCLNSGAV